MHMSIRKFLIPALVSSFLVLDVGFMPTTAQAAPLEIALEVGSGSFGTPSTVNLGSLASRSGSTLANPKLLTKSSGSSPYTMTGTDGLSGRTYQYITNQDYNYEAPYSLLESIDVTTFTPQVDFDGLDSTFPDNPGVFVETDSGVNVSGVEGLTDRSNVVQLRSEGWISREGGNSSGQAYGAVFGPEVWSVPFSGTAGQSVSFEWAAAGGDDDYEVYAFLVKISSNSGFACTAASGASSYGLTSPTTTHSLIAYGRGITSDWSAAAGSIASTGCYRFRFVSGSYDQTGGQALGAALYVDNTVILGETQTIAFPQPNDTVRSGADITISAGASTNATGATLTYTSSTTDKCEVNSSGVITLKATGTCTITVRSDEFGEYVAAEPVTRSFEILEGIVAPSGQGTGYISGSGQTCTTLSAVIGTWNDGGSPITSTTYQWSISSTAGGTYTNISGATSSSYKTTSTDLNKYIKVLFTRTNTTGSGTELSAPLLIATVGSCITARVLPAYKIDWGTNTGVGYMNPQYAYEGSIVALYPNLYKKEGYTFAGWNTKADGTGTTYADGGNFKGVALDITLYAQWKLIQTKPTITWAVPISIQQGTALSATQLNAVASVPGTYTYSPAAAATLAVGKHTLKVTFVPTDAKYETIETTVEIEVLAKPTLTWANPASISEGTALAATQLNAVASVPGTYAYSPAAATVLSAGKQALKVTFTPTDTRLSPVSAEVSIEVTPVIPDAPGSPTYLVSGDSKTTITWSAAKNAASYNVLIDGKIACSAVLTSCDVATLLGPKNIVSVTSVASGGKMSAPSVAIYAAPTSPQVLSVINFDSGKSVVNPSEAAKLRAFAATVKATGYTSLSVFGHTDSVGGVDNRKLSIARANATITYLKKLLPGVTFVLSGFAASEPVGDNSTAEGKAANRRAEIFIP
jgi:uncharacterized repeat protein (TIGR02543 family)